MSLARPRQIARWIERLLLVAGIILFGGLLYVLDAGEVLATLRSVGLWGMALIVLQEILAITANTFGWRFAFRRVVPSLPFRSLLAARLAGDAVNYVTPTATLGGEFVRVRMLQPHAPQAMTAASVAVARLAQTVGLIGFIAIGLAVTADDVPLSDETRGALVSGLVVFGLLVTAAVIVQQRGMFGAALRLATRLGVPSSQRLRTAAAALDVEIAHAYGRSRASFVFSVLGFAVGWFCGTVEVYLALWFLGLPVTVNGALAIEVLTVAFDTLVFFVPLGAGTQEAGKVLAFTLLGLPAEKGLALGILCRIRELSWALVGLVILSRHHWVREPATELQASQL
ncbi:MAG: lysylphosphatidylglycerol synthase transmembrane domain-containing protein [Pirellulales bacterium]